MNSNLKRNKKITYDQKGNFFGMPRGKITGTISTINKILSDFRYFANIFKEFKRKSGLYLYLQ